VNRHYPFLVAGDIMMTLIVAGPKHTCGTMKHWEKQDQAVCWGLNSDGQLGDMSAETSSLPQPPFGVIRYVSLALGDRHTCGATREGRVFCWGTNIRGQLGNGSATDSRVPFITRMNRRSDFTMVASGAAHTCALSGTGDVVCWGDNTAGQVGTGGKGARVLSPAAVKEATGVAAVYATGNATCAQRKDGTVACWGSNASGLFGSPDLPSTRTPAPVLTEVTLSGISLGAGSGCGLQADGRAVCWGQSGAPASK
jgi:alpha-tubulin suppressor-like RCC1 family protein